MMLGNLSITEIEDRIGINFPEDTREFMKKNYQRSAQNINNGEWHCFDIPFCLVCGSMDTAKKIYDSVKDRAGEVKEQLQISINEKK